MSPEGVISEGIHCLPSSFVPIAVEVQSKGRPARLCFTDTFLNPIQRWSGWNATEGMPSSSLLLGQLSDNPDHTFIILKREANHGVLKMTKAPESELRKIISGVR